MGLGGEMHNNNDCNFGCEVGRKTSETGSPVGCTYNIEDGTVVFNTHAVGQPEGHKKNICTKPSPDMNQVEQNCEEQCQEKPMGCMDKCLAGFGAAPSDSRPPPHFLNGGGEGFDDFGSAPPPDFFNGGGEGFDAFGSAPPPDFFKEGGDGSGTGSGFWSWLH